MCLHDTGGFNPWPQDVLLSGHVVRCSDSVQTVQVTAGHTDLSRHTHTHTVLYLDLSLSHTHTENLINNTHHYSDLRCNHRFKCYSEVMWELCIRGVVCLKQRRVSPSSYSYFTFLSLAFMLDENLPISSFSPYFLSLIFFRVKGEFLWIKARRG